MNILILTSTFPSNRNDLIQHPFQLDFIDLIRRENHNITVLTHARSGICEKVREDLDIVWFPWRKVKGRLAEINFFKVGHSVALLSLIYNGVKYTRRIIVQRRIDIVICLWVIPSGFYIYVNSVLKKTGVPYVLWALGSDINKYRQNIPMRFLLKKIIRGAASVFADGFELCDTIHAISGKSCEFLPTFRKIEINSVPDNTTNGISRSCVSFLYVGRHSRVKGIDLLIKAIISLKKEVSPLKYCVTIIGEGDLTSEMMRMVTEKGLENMVIFAGKVPDDDLFRLYAQSDCVIIPSRAESVPVVFSESLQFNKPMIVTDVGDMGMLGRKYGVARVVEKENVAALAEAIRDFIMDPLFIDQEKRRELLSLLTMETSMHKMLTVISGSGAK